MLWTGSHWSVRSYELGPWKGWNSEHCWQYWEVRDDSLWARLFMLSTSRKQQCLFHQNLNILPRKGSFIATFRFTWLPSSQDITIIIFNASCWVVPWSRFHNLCTQWITCKWISCVSQWWYNTEMKQKSLFTRYVHKYTPWNKIPHIMHCSRLQIFIRRIAFLWCVV